MKKIVLLALLFIGHNLVNAQTKSTGVVVIPSSGMSVKFDLNQANTTVTMTLTGPSDRWFGIQFGDFANGEGMATGQDLVYYNGTNLVDASFNGIGALPTNDTNNWTVTSNTVATGTRTIIATRAFNTGSTSDYAFDIANSSVDIVWAKRGLAGFSFGSHSGSRGYMLDVAFANLSNPDFENGKKKVLVYPNPTEGFFSIESQIEVEEVKIYDLSGKFVKEVRQIEGKFDVLDVVPGTYLVEVAIENTKEYFKIIKK